MDSGGLLVEGKQKVFHNIRESSEAGIVMIFQELSLCPTLTVTENIYLNRELKHNGFLDKKRMRAEVEKALKDLRIEASPDDKIENLPVGTCQLVEIAKALHTKAKVLILDEPTASLTDREIDILFDRIRDLKKKGISFIYISHRMKEILQIADRVSVLHDGQMVMTKRTEDTTIEEIISEITSGSRGDLEYKPHGAVSDDILFSVKDLSVDNIVKNISFSIHKGEVVGLAGLMGSGRTETAESIFGIRNAGNATFSLNGKDLHIRNVEDAIREGIALVPEDRRREGLILEHTLEQNICLTNLEKIKSGILTSNVKSNTYSNACINKLKIKAHNCKVPMISLSGGNQQKAVIVKWLTRDPKLLIMDEPTAGVDIGAKGEVIDIIRDYTAKGNGVLFISSEMSEMMAICDRILVLCDGVIKDEYLRKDINDEEIKENAIQQ